MSLPPEESSDEVHRTPPPRRHWLRHCRRWLGIVMLTPLLLFVIYAVGTLTWSYSEGIRAGYLQKFSRKGWLCKTWEGELALTTVPGVAPVIWRFTVRNDAAARQLAMLPGRRVMLFYREHRGIPTSCFGDTGYFVDSARMLH
jgi:hypothetical protein